MTIYFVKIKQFTHINFLISIQEGENGCELVLYPIEQIIRFPTKNLNFKQDL